MPNPWPAIVRAVESDEPLDGGWMQKQVRPYLLGLRVADARALYADLCKIQIAAYEKTVPTPTTLETLVDWSDPHQLQRFVNLALASGHLTELLADCIELPTRKLRRKHWSDADATWGAAAVAHRRNSVRMQHLSAFRMASREENSTAYDRIRSECDDTDSDDWKKVICWTPERLARHPRGFWRGLRVAGCTPEEKRALIHKLTMCQPYSSCPDELSKICNMLTTEEFVRQQTPHQSHLKRFLCSISRVGRNYSR